MLSEAQSDDGRMAGGSPAIGLHLTDHTCRVRTDCGAVAFINSIRLVNKGGDPLGSRVAVCRRYFTLLALARASDPGSAEKTRAESLLIKPKVLTSVRQFVDTDSIVGPGHHHDGLVATSDVYSLHRTGVAWTRRIGEW